METAVFSIVCVLIGYALRCVTEPKRVPTVRLVVPKGQTVSLVGMEGTTLQPCAEAFAPVGAYQPEALATPEVRS